MILVLLAYEPSQRNPDNDQQGKRDHDRMSEPPRRDLV